jgi:hypothetical protein
LIGVLPKNFEMSTLDPVDVLGPQALDEPAQRKSQHGTILRAYARLKPGVNIAQAKSEPLLKVTWNWAPAFVRINSF